MKAKREKDKDQEDKDFEEGFAYEVSSTGELNALESEFDDAFETEPDVQLPLGENGAKETEESVADDWILEPDQDYLN